jgi:hypothetical protein
MKLHSFNEEYPDYEPPEPRRTVRMARCQCGDDDLPGRCPGPAVCPYSDLADHDELELELEHD